MDVKTITVELSLIDETYHLLIAVAESQNRPVNNVADSALRDGLQEIMKRLCIK